ncbi:hypothetical protein E8E12_009380 [Didymella heteroderae]|uniref:Hydrolase n=1 Tax=Didymella heteroderae TaxID=1769908 RepID=A0A9P5C2H2_9PLEO|nr:hypothetical protein E8E12_009380 [Didymella heteroderae]
MRSSYTGWAHSTLDNDATDIAAFVAYLKRLGKKRIVLMGSSTGCQDCMQFMEEDPAIYAYILQAPTSDRLTATTVMAPEDYSCSLDYTREQIAQGNLEGTVPKELIPPLIKEPVTILRWYSLIAPGNEDYFHPDLDEEKMHCKFHVMNRPTLMLPSENDEMIPPSVDKAALLKRWIQASSLMVSQLSAVVPEADHTLSSIVSRRWVADRVVQFLRSVDTA